MARGLCLVGDCLLSFSFGSYNLPEVEAIETQHSSSSVLFLFVEFIEEYFWIQQCFDVNKLYILAAFFIFYSMIHDPILLASFFFNPFFFCSSFLKFE